MRESMGGTWLFGIVIVFIALFASFLAYSISYTRAFNVKNEIINYIERNEGFAEYKPEKSSDDIDGIAYLDDVDKLDSDKLLKSTNVEANILGMIKKAGYNYSDGSLVNCQTVGHIKSKARSGGYCITKFCAKEKEPGDLDDYNVYYRVTTFIALTLPVVNITLDVPISGETRTLYIDTGHYDCEAIVTTGNEVIGLTGH